MKELTSSTPPNFGRLHRTVGTTVADVIRPYVPSERFRLTEVVRIVNGEGEALGVIAGSDRDGRWRVASAPSGALLLLDEAALAPSGIAPDMNPADLPRKLVDAYCTVRCWHDLAVGDLVEVRYFGRRRFVVRGVHEGSGDVILQTLQGPLVARLGERDLSCIMDHHSLRAWRAHLRDERTRRAVVHAHEAWMASGIRSISRVVARINAAQDETGDGER